MVAVGSRGGRGEYKNFLQETNLFAGNYLKIYYFLEGEC
jgi:hypothetical protein